MSITTKSGDEGKTTTVNCNCQSKGDYLFEVLGTLDELMAHIGYMTETSQIIQQQLYDICEHLSYKKESVCFVLPVFEAFYKSAEEETIKAGKYPKDFIHIGTSSESRDAHICRTICRRLERTLVRYRDEYNGNFDSTILSAINRLSDILYLVACFHEEKIIYVNKRRDDAK